jgi:hypothetical protein
MVTGSKILEAMYRLMHTLETDWTEDLERLNIDLDCEEMYQSEGVNGNTRFGNIILCYTVLAYDNRSQFLEPHKDRWENKRKIITKLAGLSALTIPLFNLLIENKHDAAFNLATWYINYQKDSKWNRWITLKEFDSMAQAMAKKGALDAQEGVQIGRMLIEAEKAAEKANELLNDMKKEFLSLDTALEKEERPRVTDMENQNFMSYENWLDKKETKQA